MAENLRRNGGKSPCRWQTRADLCSMAEMKPVMDAYWDFLSSFSSEKDSNLQKAQTYSLHQRKQLEAVLLDGRL